MVSHCSAPSPCRRTTSASSSVATLERNPCGEGLARYIGVRFVPNPGRDMTDADVKTPEAAETHSFQAEVAELLRLMVHSVYSETDVFLRELISNASDACDRLRYEAIANPDLLVEDPELTIRLTPDKDAGTLTVSDNGIGMDRQELIDSLGRVASSGTRAFMNKLAEAKDSTSLIGQFGVGFY